MIKPRQCFCDFCGCEIKDGDHFGEVEVPLPKSLRRELLEYFDSVVAPRYKSSPLFLISGGADGVVPRTWKLMTCIGCIFGFLPNVRETLSRLVRERVQAELDSQRRHQAAQEELEEDERQA